MQAIPITKEVEQAFQAVRTGAATQKTAAGWLELNPSTFNKMYRRWKEKAGAGDTDPGMNQNVENTNKVFGLDQSTQGNDTENEL